MKIYKPSELQAFLKELGIHAKSGLSQNFLIDGNIIQKIVQSASVSPGDFIIEIGSGPGALTEALLESGAFVTAIEMDPVFANALKRLQTQDERLQVVNTDILEFPLIEFLQKHRGSCKTSRSRKIDDFGVPCQSQLTGSGRSDEAIPEWVGEEERRQGATKERFCEGGEFCNCLEGKKYKVVANLPYHITTPILTLFLPLHQWIESLTIMVQKEFADRMIAEKGTEGYSSFSVFLQFYSTVMGSFIVSPNCFFPRPKVYSSVVHCKLHPPLIEKNADIFFQLTRTAFGQRRKMLRSSLKDLYGAAKVEQALLKIGHPITERPEELSIEEFISLYDALNAS